MVTKTQWCKRRHKNDQRDSDNDDNIAHTHNGHYDVNVKLTEYSYAVLVSSISTAYIENYFSN